MAMSDPDAYETIGSGPEVEVRVRGSRFLGQAFPAPGGPEAAERLAEVRRRYHDATHHCWASVHGEPEATVERFDDDGEPAGTAGLPVLNSLRRAGVTDALIVVTRYFGGTKLGTGGLARAYGESADAAIAAAPRKTLWKTEALRVRFDYGDLGAVEAVVAKAAGAILEISRSFDPHPELALTLKRSRAGFLLTTLTEATAGRAKVLEDPTGR